MYWKLKCAAFHVLEHVPFRRTLLAMAQQRISGRYFQALTPEVLSASEFHLANFRGGVALEFGAGRNLLASLLLSNAGAERIHAYDLDRLATLEQVNAVIEQLRELKPGRWAPVQSFDDLLRIYRIDYRAPGDARHTGLPAGSVDFIYSTSTLEHIPPREIRAILAECVRVASPEAQMSFTIDYHDHYASADKSITRTNFYRYSDAMWRWFNPSMHYQSRLRHSDYARLFDELGLHTVRADARLAQIDIDRQQISEQFRNYDDRDLAAMNGYFVLRAH